MKSTLIHQLFLAAANSKSHSMSLESLNGSIEGLDNSHVMEERKTKAVKVYVGNLFRNFWKMEQNMMDWKINPNMISFKNQKVSENRFSSPCNVHINIFSYPFTQSNSSRTTLRPDLSLDALI